MKRNKRKCIHKIICFHHIYDGKCQKSSEKETKSVKVFLFFRKHKILLQDDATHVFGGMQLSCTKIK